jgi:hypothetical protein
VKWNGPLIGEDWYAIRDSNPEPADHGSVDAAPRMLSVAMKKSSPLVAKSESRFWPDDELIRR